MYIFQTDLQRNLQKKRQTQYFYPLPPLDLEFVLCAPCQIVVGRPPTLI